MKHKQHIKPDALTREICKRGGRDYTRELVRQRDGRRCQMCGKQWEPGIRRFDVHHLNGNCGRKSFDYDRVSDMDGLITYCHRCHINLDTVLRKMRTRTGEVKQSVKGRQHYITRGLIKA